MSDQTYTITELRRPAGRWRVDLSKANNGGLKTRAHWLIEALGGKWNRRVGYHLSKGRVEVFKLLYAGGWSASWRLGSNDKRPYTFSLPGGTEMSLRDAVAHAMCKLSMAPYHVSGERLQRIIEQNHPSGLSGEHDCVMGAIHQECLHGA